MGKRLKNIITENDFSKSYSVEEAVDMAIKTATTKFNETIDICMNLNIDPKNGEQNVRGKIKLPKSLGKNVKVCVFASDDKQQEAKDAGADIVGSDELVEKVENGFVDFDRCISTPDMMSKVGKLGKVLGPRNLMPNPKLGSVTNDLRQAIEDAKSGELEFKNSDTLIQAGIAKSDFEKSDVINNIKFFYETISKERPSGIKGDFVKKVSISPTMGPGYQYKLGLLWSVKMKREQKEIFIKNLKTILSENSLVLVFHYRGMSMTDMTELRVQSFNSGCNIKVTKNRLTKLALEGTDKSELSELFDGPTAIAYSNDPVELTKLLTNFAKNNSNLVILGGIMDNEILTVEKIEILSKLPSLEEIRAQLIGLISTPAQKIASVLTAPSGDLARVFNAYSTK